MIEFQVGEAVQNGTGAVIVGSVNLVAIALVATQNWLNRSASQTDLSQAKDMIGKSISRQAVNLAKLEMTVNNHMCMTPMTTYCLERMGEIENVVRVENGKLRDEVQGMTLDRDEVVGSMDTRLRECEGWQKMHNGVESTKGPDIT